MAIDSQRGQAVAESLAGLALVVVLATALVSIGRLQWRGLEASHAARAQAFRYAVGDRAAVAAPLSVVRANGAAAFVGPGGARFAALRRELGVEDRGMVTAHAAVAVPLHRQHGSHAILRRHTAILADAGHAPGDQHTQDRIAASRAAWGDAAFSSLAAARQARSGLKDIDLGWARPAPELDWLRAWADLVPADSLDRPRSGRGHYR
jgi:hypothetical protein